MLTSPQEVHPRLYYSDNLLLTPNSSTGWAWKSGNLFLEAPVSVGERLRGRWPESVLESQMLSSAIHTQASGGKKGIMRFTQGGSHIVHLYMYVHVLVCVYMCVYVRAHVHAHIIHGHSKLYQYDGSETQFANNGKIYHMLY